MTKEDVEKELIDSGELERAELIKKLSKGKEKRKNSIRLTCPEGASSASQGVAPSG